MSVNGTLSIIKTSPINATYNKVIYNQKVLGMDYSECPKPTLFNIDFKHKHHAGQIGNLHENPMSFSI